MSPKIFDSATTKTQTQDISSLPPSGEGRLFEMPDARQPDRNIPLPSGSPRTFANPMSTTQNYKVPVFVDGEEHSSVFHKTVNNQFDLRYGWAKYMSCLHEDLDSAKGDFLEHLKKERPKKNVTLGEAAEITEAQAKSLSPN